MAQRVDKSSHAPIRRVKYGSRGWRVNPGLLFVGLRVILVTSITGAEGTTMATQTTWLMTQALRAENERRALERNRHEARLRRQRTENTLGNFSEDTHLRRREERRAISALMTALSQLKAKGPWPIAKRTVAPGRSTRRSWHLARMRTSLVRRNSRLNTYSNLVHVERSEAS